MVGALDAVWPNPVTLLRRGNIVIFLLCWPALLFPRPPDSSRPDRLCQGASECHESDSGAYLVVRVDADSATYPGLHEASAHWEAVKWGALSTIPLADLATPSFVRITQAMTGA